MDPTLLAAIVGIVGVILGALIGGIFVQRATKRQIEVMLVQSRGDVNERLYNSLFTIYENRFSIHALFRAGPRACIVRILLT